MYTKMFTIENEAKKHNLADDELIDLYDRITYIIYDLEENYDYECVASGIGNNEFDFTIKVKKNEKIPEKLTNIFFIGMSIKFKVGCELLPKKLQTKTHDYYKFIISYY